MENYFDIQAVSNSSLKYINPEEGGSPELYKLYIDKGLEKKKSKALDVGNFFHLYLLEKDKFVVNKFDRPTQMMGDLCDDFVELMRFPIPIPDNSELVLTEKTPKKQDEEMDGLKDGFTQILLKFKGKDFTEDDLNYVITAFRKARGDRYGFGGSRPTKELTVLQNFLKQGGLEYCYEKVQNANKQSLTQEDKSTLDKMVNNFYGHPVIHQIFNTEEEDGIVVIKEHEFTWDEEIEDFTGEIVTLTLKAKIDFAIIDLRNNVIIEADVKSTGYPVVKFGKYPMGAFWKLRYYRQRAFYKRAITHHVKLVYGLDITDFDYKSYMAVVESSGICRAGAFFVPPFAFAKGDEEIRTCLSRIALCQRTNDYNQSWEEIVNEGQLVIDVPDFLNNK